MTIANSCLICSLYILVIPPFLNGAKYYRSFFNSADHNFNNVIDWGEYLQESNNPGWESVADTFNIEGLLRNSGYEITWNEFARHALDTGRDL